MQSVIEEMFLNYQQTEEYAKAEQKMSRKNEVAKAQNIFVNSVIEQDSEKGHEYDSILTGALSAMEDFGFVQGFKYAMRLKKECDTI